MEEPSHLRSTLSHRGAEVEFYYPAGLSWRCIRCGRCCMDVEGRDRRVMLLEKDLERLKAAGEQGFYTPIDGDRFVAVTKKRDGRCVFLGEEGCRVYETRPLLCRMYPFYVDRQGDVCVIGVDGGCPGVGGGPLSRRRISRGSSATPSTRWRGRACAVPVPRVYCSRSGFRRQSILPPLDGL